MPAQKTPEQVIATRENPVYTIRKEQLGINLLGLYGGRPYVDARLSRYAGESSTDWAGDTRQDGSRVTGRKQQAHAIPLLGRVAEKVAQYVFGIAPDREGLPDDVAADISSDGTSVNDLMREVSNLVTACRWCWIKIDAPPREEGVEVTLADKRAGKYRPYWQSVSAERVVDWFIDAAGVVQWVLEAGVEYEGSDPLAEPETRLFRRLWTPGRAVTYYLKEGGSEVDGAPVVVDLSLAVVPWIPCGKISDKPYGFDDLESINRTIMDLESANRQNFFNTVFAQPYIPDTALQSIMEHFHVNAEKAVSMITGMNYPILLGADDREPGYMMPDASCIGTMRAEITELKASFWDTVGLMLRKESKQVESAESKRWDNLDVQQVMRDRAELLEDAEKKAVEVSRAWDDSFPAWEPAYNREFDVGDFNDEMEALVMASGVTVPDSVSRLIASKVYDRVKSIGANGINPELEAEILKDLETFSAAQSFADAVAPPDSSETFEN